MSRLGFVRFALIHSPLVGPSTWRRVGEVLADLGHEVEVPDLRRAAQTGDPHRFISAAREVVSADTDVVAGHSGAGFFLPSIAAARAQSTWLMFVDAGMPPFEGSATPAADFASQLRALSVNGVLPRWSEWWGEHAMERLVPDERLRAEILAELVEVPLTFYETPITVPDRWCERAGGYVLLSDSYRADAEIAIGLEWPTVRLIGSHLDLVNHPSTTAQAMVQLTTAL